ncbi:MAG TPA: hypothetical protein DEB46_13770, partial [Myxococcales bacterium]|nr:hypothetical protein [Myxococcales bacterium]
LFNWQTAIDNGNQLRVLLDGLQGAGTANDCVSVGRPLDGSSGSGCSMTWEHNNGGGETHDIPTLGCSCHVWDQDGMKWGQIDALSNYNGVSHRGGDNGWNHNPQTASGCIHVYVR